MRVKDLKKGQRFIEVDRGLAFVCVAAEDAHEVSGGGRDGFECRSVVIDGVLVKGTEYTLFETHNPGAYALHLYEVSSVKEG